MKSGEKKIEKKDIKWRTVLRDRDNSLKASMDSRDNNCMNSLGHCQQSFHMMSYVVKNNIDTSGISSYEATRTYRE